MTRREPRPLDALLRRAIQLGRGVLESVERWIRPDEPAPARPHVPEPRTLLIMPPPSLRAPSRHHDVEAEPIRVRMSSSVYRRLLREFLAHMDAKDGEHETGWVPVGEFKADELVITGLLPKGPKSRASWGDFEIDREFVLAALLLIQTKEPLGVVGLVHSHPGDMDWNSTTDLETDRENVKAVAGGAAIYPILTKESIDAEGHVALCSSIRTTFWGMRSGRPGVYVRCEVAFDERLADASSWLVPYERALEECAASVFELAAAHSPLSLKPAADEEGAIDLLCSRGDERAHIRFSPKPGPSP